MKSESIKSFKSTNCQKNYEITQTIQKISGKHTTQKLHEAYANNIHTPPPPPHTHTLVVDGYMYSDSIDKVIISNDYIVFH